MTEDESKEVYAHYGLTICCTSVLEHGAANALCTLELFPGRAGAKTQSEWEAKVDEHYAGSFGETLGRLIARLKTHSAQLGELASLIPDLEQCVVRRNFLVHHFWRERAGHWLTDKKRRAMIHELEADRELFWKTDKRLEAMSDPIAAKHGATPERLRATMEAMTREALSDE